MDGSDQWIITLLFLSYQIKILIIPCSLICNYKIISAIQNKISYRLNIIPPFKKSWLPLGFTWKIKGRTFVLKVSHVEERHPIVQRAVAMGRVPFGSPTLSDQALMSFPSLKMGPGKSSRSHTADEFIFIQEIEEAIGLYLKLLDGAIL